MNKSNSNIGTYSYQLHKHHFLLNYLEKTNKKKKKSFPQPLLINSKQIKTFLVYRKFPFSRTYNIPQIKNQFDYYRSEECSKHLYGNHRYRIIIFSFPFTQHFNMVIILGHWFIKNYLISPVLFQRGNTRHQD